MRENFEREVLAALEVPHLVDRTHASLSERPHHSQAPRAQRVARRKLLRWREVSRFRNSRRPAQYFRPSPSRPKCRRQAVLHRLRDELDSFEST